MPKNRSYQQNPPPLESVDPTSNLVNSDHNNIPEKSVKRKIKFKLDPITTQINNDPKGSLYIILPKKKLIRSSFIFQQNMLTLSHLSEFSHYFSSQFSPPLTLPKPKFNQQTSSVAVSQNQKSTNSLIQKNQKPDQKINKIPTKTKKSNKNQSTHSATATQTETSSPNAATWLLDLEIDPLQASDTLTENDFEFGFVEDVSNLDSLNIALSSEEEEEEEEEESSKSKKKPSSKQKMSNYFNWTPPPKNVRYAFGNIPISKLPESFNFSKSHFEKRKASKFSICSLFPDIDIASHPKTPNTSSQDPNDKEIHTMLTAHLNSNLQEDDPIQIRTFRWCNPTESAKKHFPPKPKSKPKSKSNKQPFKLKSQNLQGQFQFGREKQSFQKNNGPLGGSSFQSPHTQSRNRISNNNNSSRKPFFAPGVKFEKRKSVRSKRNRN